MFITPAFAQAAAAGNDTNSMLMSLLPFALIFVIMYFLILRPQQKKVKDHAEMVKNIRRGDTIVTSGGLVARSPRWWTTSRSSSNSPKAFASASCVP